MFGVLENGRANPMPVLKRGNRMLTVTSGELRIVSSQHDYFFIPTTQRQIII
jgi:hypothetical protein